MARSRAHRLVQKLGKIRDDYTCAVCGARIPPDEADYKYQVEGHHIIEYHEGGPAALENIVTLCSKCHDAYHAGEIEVDIISW